MGTIPTILAVCSMEYSCLLDSSRRRGRVPAPPRFSIPFASFCKHFAQLRIVTIFVDMVHSHVPVCLVRQYDRAHKTCEIATHL